MKIIGISGKMRVGKTTLANLIVAQVPGARKMAFADQVRAEVADLLGLSEAFVRKQIFKDMFFRIGSREMTGREVLQYWGTEIRRAANPAYWVEQTGLALIQAQAEGCPLVVLDDIRFVGEAELVGHDDTLIRLDPYEGWQAGPGAAHRSETELDGYPFTRRYAPSYGALGTLADDLVREVTRGTTGEEKDEKPAAATGPGRHNCRVVFGPAYRKLPDWTIPETK